MDQGRDERLPAVRAGQWEVGRPTDGRGGIPHPPQDGAGSAAVGRRRLWGAGERRFLLPGLFLLILLAFLIPALRQAARAGGGSRGWTAGGLRETICRALASVGLPPTSTPLFSAGEARTTAATETESGAGETAAEPSDFPAQETPSEAVSEPSSDTAFDPPAETDPPAAESDTLPSTDVPIKVVCRDMSESERGYTHLWNETDLVPALASGTWTPPDESPTVLLVCSHPYETYADDPQTTISDIAATLAEELRTRGVRVIFVGNALSGLTAASSVRECYTRTQALVRYYCRLYGNISLVLDLRRSAETVGEARLAPIGEVDGLRVAQVRVVVDGLRIGTDASDSSDVATAVALRKALFERSPTLSRPVYLRASQGLIAAASDGPLSTCLLTLELGGSGNRRDDATAAVPFLAGALAAVLGGA